MGKRMERIYVCSPLRPRSHDPVMARQELKENLERAKRASRLVASVGAMPLTPHLYGTQFLDDDIPAERELGMRIGLEWLADADECWVFSEYISEGMRREIDYCSEHRIPVRMICESGGLIEKLREKVMKEATNG